MDNTNNNAWGMFSELPEPEIPAAPTTRNISPGKPVEVERVQKHAESKTGPIKAAKKGRKEIFIPVVADEEKAKEFFASMKEDKKTERKEKLKKTKSKKEPKIRKDMRPPEPEKPKRPKGRPRKYATLEEANAAKKKKHYKYLKTYREEIRVSFNTKFDAVLLAFLHSKDNLTQYIKDLVTTDMGKNIAANVDLFAEQLDMQRITHENGDEITLDEIDPDDLIERIFEYENILVSIGLIKK